MSRFHKQFFTFGGLPGNNHCIYRKCFRFFCRTALLRSLFHIILSLRRPVVCLMLDLCKNLENFPFSRSFPLSDFFFQDSLRFYRKRFLARICALASN